jgi:hypothetical protein
MRLRPFHTMLAVSVAVAVTGVTLGLQARTGPGDDGFAERRTAVPHREHHTRIPVERTIAPPLPIAPRFGAGIDGAPRLEWRLAEDTDGARVELCPTDDFADGTTRHMDVVGEELALPAPWPAGVWYWRLRGLSAGTVGDRATPTWMVFVSDSSGASTEAPQPSTALARRNPPAAPAEPAPPPQFVPTVNDENDPEWYSKVAALIDEVRSPGGRQATRD